MKKMFIGNLPAATSEDDINELFSEFGTVRAVKLASDIFTGKCRGFGFIEMEGHEARAAISALDGKMFKGQALKVREEIPKKKGRRGGGRRR